MADEIKPQKHETPFGPRHELPPIAVVPEEVEPMPEADEPDAAEEAAEDADFAEIHKALAKLGVSDRALERVFGVEAPAVRKKRKDAAKAERQKKRDNRGKGRGKARLKG